MPPREPWPLSTNGGDPVMPTRRVPRGSGAAATAGMISSWVALSRAAARAEQRIAAGSDDTWKRAMIRPFRR